MGQEAILLQIGLATVGLTAAAILAFHSYVLWKYGNDILRVFEEKPPFVILPSEIHPQSESLTLTTASGRRLAASLIPHAADQCQGTILFCHEFGATRWLCLPYIDYLRADGFNILAMDFCNCGESAAIPGYAPLHWVTRHEVEDVTAAIAYLKSRPELAPRGVGLFGVSRGGGAALSAAAHQPFVKAIATDGAFPIHGTVMHYILLWVTIFVDNKWIYRRLPHAYYRWLARDTVRIVERRRQVKYECLEEPIQVLSNQALLMIHGQRDNYIKQPIIEQLFQRAPEPKELWVVPRAKHNGCLNQAGDEYRRRVRNFFRRYVAGLEPMPETECGVALGAKTGSATNGSVHPRDPVRGQPAVPATRTAVSNNARHS